MFIRFHSRIHQQRKKNKTHFLEFVFVDVSPSYCVSVHSFVLFGPKNHSFACLDEKSEIIIISIRRDLFHSF